MVGLIYNKNKSNAVRFYRELKKYLDENSIKISDDFANVKFIIVIGGDGTLIGATKKIYKYNKPVLAINMGSLGFMTDVKEEEAFSMIDDILKGDYTTENRYFLEVNLDGEINYALNDMIVAKSGIISRLIKLELHSKKEYINTYRADGVIIATPTGSTAYSMSAGGPIVKPSLKAMIITPVAPHTLSARPIVVNGEDEITVSRDVENRDIYITIDGQESMEFYKESKLSVKLSEKHLKLIKPRNRGYYSVLREKLSWGEKLC